MDEPIDAAGAAQEFLRRTGIDLATDPAVKKAAGMALVAGLLAAVGEVEEWAQPFRKPLRSPAPELPAWISRAASVVNSSSTKEPRVQVTFDTISKGDLITVVTGAIDRVEELRSCLARITETLGVLKELDQEFRSERLDGEGRVGRFIEPTPSNHPPDESRLRFARRLDREWTRLRRPKLGATEIALAAVHVGLDHLDDGQEALVRRWTAQIGRDKAKTARVLGTAAPKGAGKKRRGKRSDRGKRGIGSSHTTQGSRFRVPVV